MPKISLATDTIVQDYKHLFAVGVDQPLYGILELYGEDGPDTYYVWLVRGKMEGLCCGLVEGVQTAIDRGWHVYAFNTLEEAMQAALLRDHLTTESESISLYFCALALAENYHGADSLEYRHVCGKFSEFSRSIGNDTVANDFAAMSQGLHVEG